MNPLSTAAAVMSVALFTLPLAAAAEDHEAGVPLTPAEAAGAWTIETGGRDVCTLTMGADHSVKAGGSCAAAMPAQPARWEPTADGMRFVGADGTSLIAFARWSNSLFVSHRSSGVDIQLRRGTPGS
jgi:hypothetical protein